MSEDRKTQQIDIVTGLLMAAGAALFVFLQLSYKAGSDGGTVFVWNYELLLYGAMGALPGWILNGVLKRQFTPRTHGERETRQPRCRECGSILGQAGERCPDCRAFSGERMASHSTGEGRMCCSAHRSSPTGLATSNEDASVTNSMRAVDGSHRRTALCTPVARLSTSSHE